MLKIVGVCGAAAVSAVLAAQAVVSLDKNGGAALAAVATMAPRSVTPPTAAIGQAAQITKADDGHFWAEATVNGARVKFLVDTGATAVALTREDAIRLGFSPARLEYGYEVMTASGQARAAKVNLKTVAVGGAKIQDVEAYVIEQGLETSLLGMTYLGRLERFEATRTALILRP